MKKTFFVLTVAVLASMANSHGGSFAQQVADRGFNPPIATPSHTGASRPVVLLDEAHFNFHTAGGRYQPFCWLLERAGYRVAGLAAPFSTDSLAGARVLVIANPLNERNRNDWSRPTPPAFSDDEALALKTWVHNGGSLLLIADHMPFPGAAENVAKAFDVTFSNGFAVIPKSQSSDIMFRKADNTLADHEITRGRTSEEAVDEIVTFTGSAFRPPPGAEPLLVFPSTAVSLEPEVAWQFDEKTPSVEVGGWCQGAVFRYGQGRVAVFGEAAMFTAQLAGPNRTPIGMNSPRAPHNAQFLLNVFRWLTEQPAGSRR